MVIVFFTRKVIALEIELLTVNKIKMLRHVSESNFTQITRLFFGSQRFKTGQGKTQNADCKLQTRGKMQTEGKMQTADCRSGVKCRLRVKCRLQTADQG